MHEDDPEFGYRFIADELERAGHSVGERRVWRLCSEHRIWSTTTKKGRKVVGQAPGPGGPRRPRPAELHRARAGRGLAHRHHRAPDGGGQALRLLHQGRLLEPDRRLRDLGPDDRRPRRLGPAPGGRPAPTEGIVVVHSDRGGQFRARSFVAVLKADRLAGSMGRVASAGDNAAMESFHSLLQKNVLDREALGDPGRARLRDRLLDRAHLQPPPPSARARQAHPGRVRARIRCKTRDAAA